MKPIHTIFMALFLAACSQTDDRNLPTPTEVDTRFEIMPASGLGNIAATRAAISSANARDLEVSVLRMDQQRIDGSVVYPENFTTLTGPMNATLTGDTDLYTYLDKGTKKYYLANGWHTKVISVYPRATEVNTANGTITYTKGIDGKTDILSTAWGEGYKDLVQVPAVSVQPTLEFSHLLTQIKLQVYSTDEIAREAWGDIVSITLNNQPLNAIVTLPGVETTNHPVLTGGGETGSLYFYTDEDQIASAGGEDIPLEAEQETTQTYTSMGYCMFAPVTEETELELTITTSVVETTTVKIPKRTYTAGNRHIITLMLRAYEIRPTGVTIKDWNDDGSEEDAPVVEI